MYGSLSVRKSEMIEYPVFVWSTLVRFYRNTRVLEATVVCSALVFLYGLAFGMFVNNWSLTQSTYFFAYTISTVGYGYYGNYSPGALAMLTIYVFTSVLASSLLLGVFVAAISDASEASIEHQLREERLVKQDALLGQRPNVHTRARVAVDVAARTVWYAFGQMLVVGIVGVTALYVLDVGMSIDKAVLFIVETMTTVGFGTNRVDMPLAKWFTTIFIVPGCLSWARFVAAVSRYPLALRRYKEVEAVLSGFVDKDNPAPATRSIFDSHIRLCEAIAADRDLDDTTPTKGLTKQDFVIHWLLITKNAHIQDVLDAREVFDQLDVDAKGVLTDNL